MVLIAPVLLIIAFIGIRFQKPKPEENNYLDKATTYPIRGFFVVLIVAAGILNLLDKNSLNQLDYPLALFCLDASNPWFSFSLGGLLFAPFFFYSGYGIFQTFKERGKEYARKIPLQQILRHYISYFLVWILYAITALALESPYTISEYLWSAVGLARIGNENWYVFVMLFMYLFSFISFRIADKKTAVIINIVLAVFFLFLLINFNVPGWLWNSTFAYLFGILYSYFRERIEKIIYRKKYNRWIFLVGSILLLIGSLVVVSLIPYHDFQAFMFALPTIFFCLTIVFFTMIFKLNSRVLSFLGKHSFWIYILYLIPFIWLKNVNFIYSNKYLLVASAVVITILLAFVFNKIFNYFWNLFTKNHGEASEQANVKIGIALSYITLFVSIIGAFVVTPRVLQYVGDEQYGLLNFANSITSWLAVISSALAASYVKFASEHQKQNKDVGIVNTSFFRLFGIIALIVVILLTGVFAIFYGFNIQLSQYSLEENRLILSLILVSGINVALSLFFAVFWGYLNFKKQFIFVRIVSLAVSFLTFALNLIFAFTTKNVLSISIISAVLTTLSSVIIVIYAFKSQRIAFSKKSYKETSPLIKSILIFSSFVLLNSIIDQINTHLDKTLLGIMVNAQTVTDYTLAKYFNGYLLILVFAITNAYIPKIHEIVADKFDSYKLKKEEYDKSLKESKQKIKEIELNKKDANDKKQIEAYNAQINEIRANNKAQKREVEQSFKNADRSELNALFLKISKMHMFITFLIVGGFVSIGFEFMNLWLGPSKEHIYYYALVPMCLDMIVFTASSAIEIQRAMNKHKFLAFLYIGIALVNIAISIALIKLFPAGYEIWGAFIGTAFSIVFGNMIILSIYNKFKIGLPIGKHMLLIVKNLFYAGAGVGLALLLRYLLPTTVGTTAKFIIQGVVFVVTFLGLQLVFERKTVLPIVKKAFAKIKDMAKGAKNNNA